jgi:hypothetical protein
LFAEPLIGRKAGSGDFAVFKEKGHRKGRREKPLNLKTAKQKRKSRRLRKTQSLRYRETAIGKIAKL